MKNLIQVTRVKENKDGSATIAVRYDKDFEKVVRTHYGTKRCSKKLVRQFVLGVIKDGIKRDIGRLVDKGIK